MSEYRWLTPHLRDPQREGERVSEPVPGSFLTAHQHNSQFGLQSIVCNGLHDLGVGHQSHSELREVLDCQSIFESATSVHLIT